MFQQAWDNIVAIFQGIGEFFGGLWDNVTGILSGIGDWFRNMFQSAWDNITGIFNGIGNFFSGVWNSVTSIFSNIGGWFRDRFQEAWNNITSIFSGIGNFFGGLWNTIKDKFSSLGTTIGDAIGGAVKAGINGIISMIENVINKGIDMINGAINLIKYHGVSIGNFDRVNLPRLYRGGVLEKGQVGILEGSGAEAVVPLEKNKGWIKAVANDMKEQMKDNNLSTTNNISNTTSNTNNFTQIINAPKQPSRLQLYRQTKNLLNLVNA